MREFPTGATRDDDDSKVDYEGHISPFVLERYGLYMHKHARQSDGNLRASDNWQLGIPIDQYLKSALRHVIVWWKLHRKPLSPKAGTLLLEDVLCAVMFNVMGYLHELMKTPTEE